MFDKNTIRKVTEEILKDWFGPTGKCWCKEKHMFVDPETCGKECPECEALRSKDIRQFRYLHLHDDFKSY